MSNSLKLRLILWVPSPSPTQAIKTISTVKLSGKRLLQLINDILDAAKMKQGALVIKHEKVQLPTKAMSSVNT